ncbi:Uncharacterised protein r2_g3958 [Pycnogonum litorale]
MSTNEEWETGKDTSSDPKDGHTTTDSQGGARPKIRSVTIQNPLQQARAVPVSNKKFPLVGKSRNISSRPLLESVTESDTTESSIDSSYTLSSGMSTSSTKNYKDVHIEGSRCGSYFGIKSYLHQFYDSNQGKSQGENDSCTEEDECDEDDDYHYLIGPDRSKKSSKRLCSCGTCWRICLWTGINIVIIGSVLILVGFFVPTRSIVVGHKDDIEIIDKGAKSFNHNLELCRVAGLGLLCVGVALLSIVLLLPSCIKRFYDTDVTMKHHHHHEPFKWKVGVLEPPRTPTEKKIPVTEEVSGVQPRIEPPHSVILSEKGITEVR